MSRSGETYLMRAELKVRKGDYSSAMVDITGNNELRLIPQTFIDQLRNNYSTNLSTAQQAA